MNNTFDIDQVLGFNFDAEKIKNEIAGALNILGMDPLSNQLNLYHREGSTTGPRMFLDFNGSLHPQKNKTGMVTHESEFNIIHPLLKGTYTEEVCEAVRGMSKYPLGRVRLLGLNPKSCYSWHQDPDIIRYHIPLKTFVEAFFVVDEGVYRMPNEGGLYTINSTKWHTAVNAAFNKRRTHLVFDTYSSLDKNPYERTVEDADIKFDTSNIY